jgi:hypothetical protein
VKVDVVYPLAAQSKGRKDFELRYSLRSLAAQDWVRDIYLVGYKPVWVKGVKHIECPDPYVAKDANIINKILLAASQPGISQGFVVNSDDQYIMRPIALSELGPWCDPGSLPHAKSRLRHSRWCERLVGTVAYCKANGLPTFVLDSHIPYLIGKDSYREAFSRVAWGRGNGFTTHLYFNLTLTESPPDIPHGLSVHATAPMATIPDPVPAFFNHNDNGLSQRAQRWLESVFPDPSPWEA